MNRTLNETLKTMTVNEAMTEALREEMRRDERVVFLGEGVATESRMNQSGLAREFGPKRVRNTPLSEGIIAGTAVGAAATGLRPVIDLLFLPFVCFAMEEVANSAGKLRYVSGGQFEFPMVVLAKTGAGWTLGAQHNHNLEAWFCHTPGIQVVMPSTAADFKGLLKSAIRGQNPVIFITDIGLAHSSGEVPVSEDHLVPIGKASIVKPGRDVTLVSWAKTVHVCSQAAAVLEKEGIDAEVIDLRSLKPYDEEAVLRSVNKTGRLVVVHEASQMGGFGGEIVASVAEKAFDSLKAPIKRIAGPDVPPPSSYVLEQAYVPQESAISAAVRSLCRCSST